MIPVELVFQNHDLVLFWPIQVDRVFLVNDDTETMTFPADVEATEFKGYVLDKNVAKAVEQGAGATFHWDERYYLVDAVKADSTRKTIAAHNANIDIVPVIVKARCFFPE